MKRILVCLVALMLGAVSARADVHVSNLFSDNMVLQREIAAPVWGTADPSEAVTVKIGGAQAAGQADAQGKWMAKLPAMKANAKAQDLTISGKNTLTIKNVLVGPNCEGVELYPAEDRLVDLANQTHVWCIDDPNFRFPFGFWERAVQSESTCGAVQRPFATETEPGGHE